MPISQLEKKIYENYPLEKYYGQYNYGKIEEEDNFQNLGYIAEGSGEETHLYTLIETSSLYPRNANVTISDMKTGMVNGLNSQWILMSQHTSQGNPGESEGSWGSVQHSIMYIDGAVGESAKGCHRGQKAYEWSEYFRTYSNRDVGHTTKYDIECKATNGNNLGDSIAGYQTDDYNYISDLGPTGVSPDTTTWQPGAPNLGWESPGYSGDYFCWGSMAYCKYGGRGSSLQANWKSYGICVDNPSSQGSGIVDPNRNTINNFHLKNKNRNYGNGDATKQTTVNSIYIFNDSLKKQKQNRKDGYIFNSVRIGGDERETRGGGSRYDERDRGCQLTRLDKSCLAEIFFLTQQHDDYPISGKTFTWTNNGRSGGNKQFYGNCINQSNFYDNYGDNKGYKRMHENHKAVLTWPAGSSWKVHGPTFNILDKVKSYEDGGANANYVDKEQSGWWCVDTTYEKSSGKTPRVGLNPRYTFDAIGLPNSFKNTFDNNGRLIGNSFLKFNKIDLPYRAISTVTNSTLYNLDLQNYYIGLSAEDQLNRIFTSAPANIELKFDIAKNMQNMNPQYVNFGNPSGNDNDYTEFDYWYFVVNWDWNTGEPKNILDIQESFPKSTAEMEAMQNLNNTYKLHKIGQKEIEEANGTFESCDQYFENFKYDICSAQHTYVTSGIKVIKAIIFRTISVDEKIPKDSNNWDMENYIQAVDWQLATVKMNLSEEGLSLEADFGDLGGDDFTYLPFPGIFVNNIRDLNGDLFTGPSGQPYKSSHIVVGGLHSESNYVRSLQRIRNSDNFDESEGTEKKLLQKSYDLSPLGNLNELGHFPGKLDLAQIRFFERPINLKNFLNISYLVDGGYHPHSDSEYWNGGYNCEVCSSFPEESPVGDIFIDEYDQLNSFCLVELNMENLNQKTIRDSSGNLNVGIVIGDYSVKKENEGQSSTRDSFIQIPKQGSSGGAF